MSDYIVKIIPVDPFERIDPSIITQATVWLKSQYPADKVIFVTSKKPRFVDCGSNLERITCPACGCIIDFSWWGKTMDELYRNSGFQYLDAQTPCCQQTVSINDLHYELPCGFSCVEFNIYNPKKDVEHLLLEQFKAQTGIDAKIIKAKI